ncbi:MAG: pyridoxamine 5'-phosphate oxidase family protein [Planctomycetota bacterium]
MPVPEDHRALLTYGTTVALATAGADGTPNVVPMAQLSWFDDDTLLIGDAFMKQTLANITENPKVAVALWLDDPKVAYKYIGSARYCTDGPEFAQANALRLKKKPGSPNKGVVAIRIEKIHQAMPGPDAGAPIA